MGLLFLYYCGTNKVCVVTVETVLLRQENRQQLGWNTNHSEDTHFSMEDKMVLELLGTLGIMDREIVPSHFELCTLITILKWKLQFPRLVGSGYAQLPTNIKDKLCKHLNTENSIFSSCTKVCCSSLNVEPGNCNYNRKCLTFTPVSRIVTWWKVGRRKARTVQPSRTCSMIAGTGKITNSYHGNCNNKNHAQEFLTIKFFPVIGIKEVSGVLQIPRNVSHMLRTCRKKSFTSYMLYIT